MKRLKDRRRISVLAAMSILFLTGIATTGHSAWAQRGGKGHWYEITVTNLTRGQQFTPLLIVTHREGVQLFDLGSPASAQLETLAEEGDTGPLSSLLAGTSGVFDIATSSGLLDPGASVTVQVRGGVANARHFSLASMLIPTNDGFLALNGASLPQGRQWLSFASPAYDAGTERNDESCDSIPGPACGGTGDAPGGGEEGYVHIHAGIHGIDDLDPSVRDWRNPVARIVVRRLR